MRGQVMTSAGWNFDLRRVAVVGTSCCGKTIFARELAAVLEVPHIELDALYWLPRWAERPAAEFRGLVEKHASAERWVPDGNYSIVREVLWRRATDVVWLNYPFVLVFARALSRTVLRIVTREELFSGNRESIRQSFFSRGSILLWVLKTFRRNRSKFSTLQTLDKWKHIRFSEFRRSSQASEFLAQCRIAAQQGATANGQPAHGLVHS